MSIFCRLTMCLALALAALPSPTRADSATQVRDLLMADQLSAAIDAGEAATKTDPNDAAAWMWLGRAYGRQALEANLLTRAGWAGKCRDAWQKAAALDPQNADVRFDLIQYYLQAPGFLGGGEDKAKATAAELAALNPAWGLVANAIIATVAKDQAGAERDYRQALELAPTDHRARLGFNGLLSNLKRYDELHQFWSAQISSDPNDVMAQFLLGRNAAVSGQHLDLGLSALERASALPALSRDLLAPSSLDYRRGQVLAKLGRRDEAIAALEAALAQSPRSRVVQEELDTLKATPAS